jgi:hypothetical protein
LAQLPSGDFTANSVWLALATIALNLTRVLGSLAPTFHAKAATANIRSQLINIAACITRSVRRVKLRLPADCMGNGTVTPGNRHHRPSTTRLTRPPATGPTRGHPNAGNAGRSTPHTSMTSHETIDCIEHQADTCIRTWGPKAGQPLVRRGPWGSFRRDSRGLVVDRASNHVAFLRAGFVHVSSGANRSPGPSPERGRERP